MTYTIATRIFQTDPDTFFDIVEQTIWKHPQGGTWTEVNGAHVLTMGGSDTSGTLRFQSAIGERFFVALGVHNNSPWCDIIDNPCQHDMGTVVHAQYYEGGWRTYARERTMREYRVRTPAGRIVEVKFTVASGRELQANIIIRGSEKSAGNTGYNITVRVHQRDTDAFFYVVEKTAWKCPGGGCTWSMAKGAHVLAMDGSDTSGMLRFQSDSDERFLVTLGVHNNSPWCDIVTDTSPAETAVVVHPKYYEGGWRAYGTREETLREYSRVKSPAGRNLEIRYNGDTDGHNLVADLVIG